jgi:hypothetical protein
MQNSCQVTTQLTGSQAGGNFTPTSQADFQLTTELSPSPSNQLPHVTSLNWTADNSNQQLTRCFKLSCLSHFCTDHLDNTVSIIVQQYFEPCLVEAGCISPFFYCCVCVRCPGNLFTEQSPTDSPVIVDLFTACSFSRSLHSNSSTRYNVVLHVIWQTKVTFFGYAPVVYTYLPIPVTCELQAESDSYYAECSVRFRELKQ